MIFNNRHYVQNIKKSWDCSKVKTFLIQNQWPQSDLRNPHKSRRRESTSQRTLLTSTWIWWQHTHRVTPPMYTLAHTNKYTKRHKHKLNTQSVHIHITHTAIPKHYVIIKFWKWRSKETINWNKYLLTQIGISEFLFNIVTMLLKRDSAQSMSAMFLKAPLAILK